MKPVVIYIDEEPAALKVNGRALQKCIGSEATVVAIEPVMGIKNMVERILSHESVCSVVIDQKLKAAGTADYLGTELAAEMRSIDKKIPVYILTNFAQDLDGNDGNVEYILSKDDLAIEDRKTSISQRLRRHINVFNDIVSDRDERFEFLLRKSREQELSKEEIKEYEELGFYREKKILASELLDSAELQSKLKKVEDRLNKIKKTLGLE